VYSATKEGTVVLSAPIAMGLDDCLEYIAADELVEVCAGHVSDHICVLNLTVLINCLGAETLVGMRVSRGLMMRWICR